MATSMTSGLGAESLCQTTAPLTKEFLLRTEQIPSSKAFKLARAAIVTLTLVFLARTIGKAYRPEGNDSSAYPLAAEAL